MSAIEKTQSRTKYHLRSVTVMMCLLICMIKCYKDRIPNYNNQRESTDSVCDSIAARVQECFPTQKVAISCIVTDKARAKEKP
jgi:hypothetical protein